MEQNPDNSLSYAHPNTCVADVVAQVIGNDWVNSEYKLLVLCVPRTCDAAAGQFFNIECPSSGDDKPYLRRPMSVYRSDASHGVLEFLYKVTGAGTRGLATLQRGQSLRVLGPLGIGFKLSHTWKSIVVLGRGVGLATLAPLAELATARGVSVTALISARASKQVMSVNRFEAIGASIEILLDTDGTSDPSNVERILRRLAEDGRSDAFFTCGSNRLMLLMKRLGVEFGIPGQVALEQQMACGLGMCFCCVRNFQAGTEIVNRRVCWDGPVFDLQEAMSW